jgi:hypothetical protein
MHTSSNVIIVVTFQAWIELLYFMMEVNIMLSKLTYSGNVKSLQPVYYDRIYAVTLPK